MYKSEKILFFLLSLSLISSIIYGCLYSAAEAKFSENGKQIKTPSANQISTLEIEKETLTLDGKVLSKSELYFKRAALLGEARPRGIIVDCKDKKLWS